MIHEYYGDELDMHMSQVDINLDQLYTPLFAYIKKNYDAKAMTMAELVKTEKFKTYFG